MTAYGLLAFASVVVFCFVASSMLAGAASQDDTGSARVAPRWWALDATLVYLASLYVGGSILHALVYGHGSTGLWGAAALAGPGCLAYAHLARAPRAAVADAAGVALPAALVFAKLGCLCAGCCYGAPTSSRWAIEFGEGSLAPAHMALHPTQADDALVLAFAAAAAFAGARRRPGDGMLVGVVVMGIGRVLTGLTRGDRPPGLAIGVSYAQIVAAAAVVVAIALLAWPPASRRWRAWVEATGAPRGREARVTARAPLVFVATLLFLAVALPIVAPAALWMGLARAPSARRIALAGWLARGLAGVACLAALTVVTKSSGGEAGLVAATAAYGAAAAIASFVLYLRLGAWRRLAQAGKITHRR